MHTQRIFEHHESESQLSYINSKLLYMEFGYIAIFFSSFMLYALFSPYSSSLHTNVTIHNEGVYILFPSLILNCLI